MTFQKISKGYLIAIFVSVFVLSFSCKRKPSNIPRFTVTNLDNPTDGTILISPFTLAADNKRGLLPGYLYILDKNGTVLKSKQTRYDALDFKKWRIDGATLYSYSEYNPAGYHIPGLSNSLGDEVILDSNLNEIKRIDFLPGNGRPADQKLLDLHDFILLSKTHFFDMCYYVKAPSNIPPALKPARGIKIAAPIIQEVANGKVVWEWDASNFPELYESSTYGNFQDTAQVCDYAHMNSFFIDARDSNLIISFRYLDEIIKVSHKDGNIIWRLGGAHSDFLMRPDQKMVWQHNATLTDNGQTLLVFDNGEAGVRPSTRILEFKLDEIHKKIVSFKAFPVPGNDFAAGMGSVQKRGNTYFIGGGTGNYIMEADYVTGKILFRLKLNEPTYRAFKY